MSLNDSIDAALAAAAQQSAKPFRLDLNSAQLKFLSETGLLSGPVGPKTVSLGAYKEVNVYETMGETELLAQPVSGLRAVHFAVSS